jgi:hypothetical protein
MHSPFLTSFFHLHSIRARGLLYIPKKRYLKLLFFRVHKTFWSTDILLLVVEVREAIAVVADVCQALTKLRMISIF